MEEREKNLSTVIVRHHSVLLLERNRHTDIKQIHLCKYRIVEIYRKIFNRSVCMDTVASYVPPNTTPVNFTVLNGNLSQATEYFSTNNHPNRTFSCIDSSKII
jgi:hypothetical protein